MRRISFLLLALALALGTTVNAQEFIELAADESLPMEFVATDDFESEDPFVEELEAEEPEAEGAFNPGSTIIGHVSDAHSWHMFDYYGKDGKEHAVAIPLPIILINDGHLDIFMSSRFHHGHADYKGRPPAAPGIHTLAVFLHNATYHLNPWTTLFLATKSLR